jgi:hypothetical protein
MIIKLDGDLYLNFNPSTKTWKYDTKNNATEFETIETANEFIIRYQIKYMSPNAQIVKAH